MLLSSGPVVVVVVAFLSAGRAYQDGDLQMCHHAYLLDSKIAWYDPCGMRFCRRDRVLKYDWLLVPRVLKTISQMRCKIYLCHSSG